METRQAQEDIHLIKEMIEKTKKTAAESGVVHYGGLALY